MVITFTVCETQLRVKLLELYATGWRNGFVTGTVASAALALTAALIAWRVRS